MAAFDEEMSGGQGATRTSSRGAPLLPVLARRAWVIVLTTVLLTGVSVGIALATRNTYQSTAQLLFSQTIGPQLNALGLNPPFNGADRLAGDDVALVASRSVAVLTAQRLGGGATADSVQKHVAVAGSKTNDVVTVAASAGSATGAARLASTYANAAIELNQRTESRRALTVADSLRAQLAIMSPAERRAASGQQLLARLSNLQAIASSGTGDPQLIQPGYAPTHKAGNLAEIIALGTIFGLVLGIALALLRERSDRKLRDAEDVSAAFDAPVLATIPRHRALGRRVPFERLPSKVVDSFFMLESNLFYARGGRRPRSMIITSAAERQGKTTVAYNLAAATAAAGFSVALVDADLRRSSLAVEYGLRSFPGLSEVLREDLPVRHALQRVEFGAGSAVANGSQPTMRVLVAGARVENPSALIQSGRMAELLDALGAEHDVVIVDTPPIAQVSDAIALLRHVDGVVAVASVHSVRGPDAERLREQLQSLDARLLGVVANGGNSGQTYRSAPSAPAYAR